ncbi:MAG: ABC transporter ATP-binding protein [Thermoproteota archaeon]|jgi:branched-chain amino acid transport system ATP-binding protein|nr:ABC transporter ATP-binding protein [Thermoproteota archaeon]
MNEATLICKGIKKHFGGLYALDDVNISLERGKFTLLIGPNGSGKTTLINTITGYYIPDEGKIIYEGKDVTKLPMHEKFKLGIVRTFQIPKPFTKLTVIENMLIAARDNPGERFIYAPLKSKWIDKEKEAYETAMYLLQQLKLDNLYNQESYKLSGGQIKLLEFGRALMCNAKVILLDEPGAGMAPFIAKELFKTLKDVTIKLNLTVLVVEHRLDIALDFADYAYAMHNGKVIAEGNPYEVLNNEKVIESYLGRRGA